MTGLVSYHAGLAAEDIVARNYAARAHQVAARRWRGKSGEIDLVMRDGDTVVFVEVKKKRQFRAGSTPPWPATDGPAVRKCGGVSGG